ncbi:retron St85 family effector protein [Yersinia enterocolitica]|nr:retron St85 family effector protein [Yersinia enterocolitica]HDW2136409.1 retron St85 family effector protein [Yersinia enterocolitica]
MDAEIKNETFDDAIIDEFGTLSFSNFTLSLTPQKIFICGGETNTGHLIPQSLRERILSHIDVNESKDLSESFIMAETFKDYFRENTYTDLFCFEDDIAKLSTLIIICLESPGSLVELGMFSNISDPKKILIFAPDEHVQEEDSFIYLGPLSYLKRKDKDSVHIFPWPNPSEKNYADLPMVIDCIKNRVKTSSKKTGFSIQNPAHVAFVIHDIIYIFYPIKDYEINLALLSMNIDIDDATLKRLLYLLQSMSMIGKKKYSNITFFYSLENKKRVSFGKDKNNRIKEYKAMRLRAVQSFVLSEDEASRKRKLALKAITQMLAEGGV